MATGKVWLDTAGLGGPRKSQKSSIVPIQTSLKGIQGSSSGINWPFRVPFIISWLLGVYGTKKVNEPLVVRIAIKVLIEV